MHHVKPVSPDTTFSIVQHAKRQLFRVQVDSRVAIRCHVMSYDVTWRRVKHVIGYTCAVMFIKCARLQRNTAVDLTGGSCLDARGMI